MPSTSPASVLPLLVGREWTQTLSYRPELARLVCVVAAQVVDNRRSPDPSVLTDTIFLDISTAVDITASGGRRTCSLGTALAGRLADHRTLQHAKRQPPLLSALNEENYAVDPFDTPAIVRYFDNWIGRHPELLAYAGTTLRALFSDSFEYFPQTHFADDLHRDVSRQSRL